MAANGASLQEIAEAIGTNKRHVSAHIREHQIWRPPHRQHPESGHPMARNTKGSANPSWNGGTTVERKNGYEYILTHAPDHPHANRHGYVREHRLVMERHLGRFLDPREVVHHKNNDVQDNRVENLELFASNGEHLRATMTGVSCPARGRRYKSTPARSASGDPRS